MKRRVGFTLLLLFWWAHFDLACAESHRIEFLRPVSVNGFQLQPGKYRLSLNRAQELEIYDGRELVATAGFETEPLGSAIPNTVLQDKTGAVKEIRLKKTRIVLIDGRKGVQASR